MRYRRPSFPAIWNSSEILHAITYFGSKPYLIEYFACKFGLDGLKYLFLDEIQNVKGFEESINAYREEGEYSIFITGSNSYLLSGELATKLTGRYIEYELCYPSLQTQVKMWKRSLAIALMRE